MALILLGIFIGLVFWVWKRRNDSIGGRKSTVQDNPTYGGFTFGVSPRSQDDDIIVAPAAVLGRRGESTRSRIVYGASGSSDVDQNPQDVDFQMPNYSVPVKNAHHGQGNDVGLTNVQTENYGLAHVSRPVYSEPVCIVSDQNVEYELAPTTSKYPNVSQKQEGSLNYELIPSQNTGKIDSIKLAESSIPLIHNVSRDIAESLLRNAANNTTDDKALVYLVRHGSNTSHVLSVYMSQYDRFSHGKISQSSDGMYVVKNQRSSSLNGVAGLAAAQIAEAWGGKHTIPVLESRAASEKLYYDGC